jgi:type IV fimbrial biogenesis protein FimT
MDVEVRLGVKGFTLSEFLISVVVAALVLAFAVPSFFDLLYNSRRVSAVNAFVSRLHFTRSEAVKRGEKVVFCLSAQKTSCITGATTLWRQGIIFTDYDDDGKRDSEEEILAHFEAPSGIDIYASSRWRRKIKYYPDGMSPVSNTTVRFCDPDGEREPRAVIIANTGRPRVSETDAYGNELVCP